MKRLIRPILFSYIPTYTDRIRRVLNDPVRLSIFLSLGRYMVLVSGTPQVSSVPCLHSCCSISIIKWLKKFQPGAATAAVASYLFEDVRCCVASESPTIVVRPHEDDTFRPCRGWTTLEMAIDFMLLNIKQLVSFVASLFTSSFRPVGR